MNTQDQDRPINKGLQVAGERGAATTEARYGKEFLLAKIAEKHRAIFPSVKELQAESEAWLDKELGADTTPKPITMRDVLGPGGIIAQKLPGYETREPQLQMAEMVDEAIKEEAHLIAEAGTGTGKSLAYLIPAIYSRKQTVVSTGDKSLQEQLWRKDIPFLRSVLPIEFEAAILKGKANYLCLENWNNEAGDQMMLGESMEFAEVRKWLETTESGDIEELSFAISPELSMKITSSSDACSGQHCPQFKECYAEKAKEKAKMAQVVIVNHSLLTIDAALRARSDDFASAIPNRDIVIIDEAHRLEDAATAAFTIEVSAGGISRLINDKHVNALQESLGKQPDTVPQANRLNQLRTDIETTVTLFFGALSEMSNSQSYAVTAPPVSLQNHAQNLALQLGDLERLLESRNPYDVDRDNPAKSEAYKKFVSRVENYADAVRGSLLKSDSEVIYVEKRENRKGKQLIYLKKAPICVADDLREALFEKWPTICTSATIATEGNADYFKSRVGCDSARELIVDSPFDYRSNALIYLPRSGAVLDPTRYYGDNSPLYFDNLANEIEQLLLISDGRAFCLFTSRKALEEIHSRLHSRLRKWEVLKQGDYPRPELVKRFKEDGHAILFGLKSFWEGVDIQREALSLVVIDKIPFGQPDDPIYSARCDEIGKRTGDKWAWFNKLALPNAIITYKQGFGRLIRTKSDWGCVALLDGRITTKNYGTKILRSLPKASRTDSLAAVRTFFETRGQR